MVKKEGKYLVNARVDVDYSKEKPKVKFGYPYKNKNKEQLRQGFVGWISIVIWILIGLLPFLGIYLNSPFFSYQPDIYPSNCQNNISLDKLNYNRYVEYTGDLNFTRNYSVSETYGFNLSCESKTYILKYSEGYFSSHDQYYGEVKEGYFLVILGYIWVIFSFYISQEINKKLITRWLVKRKWYQKWLPKYNGEKRKNRKYRKFIARDMLGNVVIIPRFNNVVLDYKTSGEFSEYLEGLKIREYKEGKINVKTNKKEKEKSDPMTWYAIFYFKKKPKDGFLEVIYY